MTGNMRRYFCVVALLIAGNIAHADDASEFMAICADPTPSQRVTLEAIHPTKGIKETCDFAKRHFINDDYQDTSALTLSCEQITDLSPLHYLTRLGGLNIRNNQVTDLSPIASLKHLESIIITNNPISDFSVLLNFTKLKR